MKRRGSILISVLVVLAIGTLIGTGVLLRVDAERAGADASRRRDQSRALAWSGVQAVMVEIADARERLLAGERPELTEAWTLFEDDLGRKGVVRLIDLTPEDEGVAMPEGGKIDINSATEEMLAGVGAIGPALAKRIVEARAGKPFSSVEELLRVNGVTAELLYGSAGGETERRSGSTEEGVIDLAAFGAPGAEEERLIDLLTVFSFDPNVIGGTAGLEEFRGTARLNLNMEWSTALEREISKIWGDEAAIAVKNVMEAGITFRKDSDIIKTMRTMGIEADFWPGVLDSFCTSDDEYRAGRVDIMNAPVDVLLCVPGVSAEAAQRIADTRDSVRDEERLTPAWLVTRGILTPAEFEKAVDWVAVRSMQWRIRVEAGMTLAEDAAVEFDAERLEDAELTDRVVLDVVIDVSSQRPRVAYLRDVTLLDASRRLAGRADAVAEALGLEVEDENAEDVVTVEDAEEAPEAEAPRIPRREIVRREQVRREIQRRGDDEEEPSGEENPLDDELAETGAPSSAEGEALPRVDRRIGRWTTSLGGRR